MTIHISPPRNLDALSDRLQTVQSACGVEALLLEDHTNPLVSLSFGFKGGARDDQPEKAGTARLMANLLDEGAGTLDAGAFSKAFGKTAAQMSFSAHRDHLRGKLRTLTRTADRALDLLALAINAPRFDAEAVERMRGQALSRWLSVCSRPDHAARVMFDAVGFAKHAYGRLIGGDDRTLAAIGRADIAALHQSLARRDTLKIAAVGAITPTALGLALDRVFGDLPSSGDEARVPRAALERVGSRCTTTLDVTQSAIVFGRPAPTRGNPDFMAAHVVNHCLGGGGLSSRLFTEMREKRGLCYSVWSTLETLDGASTFVTSTSTRNDRVGEAVDTFHAEIARLLDYGIDDRELDRAKNFLIGSHALRFDGSAAIAEILLDMQLDGRDVGWLSQRNHLIAGVTAEDAARAAHRMFGDGRFLVAVAGNATRFGGGS